MEIACDVTNAIGLLVGDPAVEEFVSDLIGAASTESWASTFCSK
jgi:hypothetical protein